MKNELKEQVLLLKDLPGAKAGTVGEFNTTFYVWDFNGMQHISESWMKRYPDFFRFVPAPVPPDGWRMTGEYRKTFVGDHYIDFSGNISRHTYTFYPGEQDFGNRWIAERVEAKEPKPQEAKSCDKCRYGNLETPCTICDPKYINFEAKPTKPEYAEHKDIPLEEHIVLAHKLDMTDKEISDVADKIARMIVTEGEILTEQLWAINVAEVLAQYRNDSANNAICSKTDNTIAQDRTIKLLEEKRCSQS